MNSKLHSAPKVATVSLEGVVNTGLIKQWAKGAGRRLKPASTLGILFAGAFGIFSEQSSITANSAVISTRVVSVRTPIEGFLSAASVQTNQPVERGASLGLIANTRFDSQAQESYREQGIQSARQVAAIAAEEHTLSAQRTLLLNRVQAHTDALRDRMDRDVIEAERALAAKQAGFRLASSDLARGHQLYDAALISRAALEKLDSAATVAAEEAKAQEAALAAVRSERDAVNHGTMIELGNNNDVAYSDQRIDEINLRLADLERERLSMEATRDAAEGSYAEASMHNQAMGSAALTAPASGVLWKWFAADGEHMGAGEKVAELVNCKSAFLLAALPQDRVPAVTIGAQARYRLSGESTDRIAYVSSINAELPTLEGNKLAAEPLKVDDRPEVLIRLDVDPKDIAKGCLVGRTASVVIKAHSNDVVATLFHHYF